MGPHLLPFFKASHYQEFGSLEYKSNLNVVRLNQKQTVIQGYVICGVLLWSNLEVEL